MPFYLSNGIFIGIHERNIQKFGIEQSEKREDYKQVIQLLRECLKFFIDKTSVPDECFLFVICASLFKMTVAGMERQLNDFISQGIISSRRIS